MAPVLQFVIFRRRPKIGSPKMFNYSSEMQRSAQWSKSLPESFGGCDRRGKGWGALILGSQKTRFSELM